MTRFTSIFDNIESKARGTNTPRNKNKSLNILLIILSVNDRRKETIKVRCLMQQLLKSQSECQANIYEPEDLWSYRVMTNHRLPIHSASPFTLERDNMLPQLSLS